MSKKNNYFDLPAGLDDAELLEIFHEQNRPLRLDALLRVTGLPRAARKILEDQLYALADEGRLVRLQGGLWARADGLRQVRGRYMALRSGAGGFVTPLGDNGQVTGPDIFIHPCRRVMPGIRTWCAWPCRRVRTPAARARKAASWKYWNAAAVRCPCT